MSRLIILIVSLAFTQCSTDRTIVQISESEIEVLKEYQHLEKEYKSYIADKKEPGKRLILCLTFVNKADMKKLSNQVVKFFHTSSSGNYEQTDPNDESTARLSGRAITDNNGRIYVETVLPGDYGSSEDNRHIHTTVFGAKPEGYDIHFIQYAGFMLKQFIQGSDQHFLADLKMTKDNTLVCILTIEVKNANTTEIN